MKYLWIVVLLVGCSTTPMQMRRELFAPVPLNDPVTRTIFTSSYAQALTVAQTTPTKTNLITYIDAGNALNARNCSEWMSRVTLARRGLVLSDHNLGVASALLTTLAGISQWNPTSVAILGAAEVAAQGLGSNFQNDVLGAPSQYQAQTTILGLQQQCGDRLLEDSRLAGFMFSQAYSRLEACARICSFDAATEAANRALANTPIIVQPSGAMRVDK